MRNKRARRESWGCQTPLNVGNSRRCEFGWRSLHSIVRAPRSSLIRGFHWIVHPGHTASLLKMSQVMAQGQSGYRRVARVRSSTDNLDLIFCSLVLALETHALFVTFVLCFYPSVLVSWLRLKWSFSLGAPDLSLSEGSFKPRTLI